MATSTITSPSTTTAAFDYLYEFSETRKVLEEFFKCPPVEEESALHSEFHDLDYELRLHGTDSGSSYVGQRLAKGRPEQCDFTITIDSPKKHSSNSNMLGLQVIYISFLSKHEFLPFLILI